jgi:hypothetical protein
MMYSTLGMVMATGAVRVQPANPIVENFNHARVPQKTASEVHGDAGVLAERTPEF